MTTVTRNIAVVGAGPAGLMAAEVLASAGMRVTIFDHMPSAGRKLLMAGRGGLNLTHSEPLENFLTRYGPGVPEPVLAAVRDFPPGALVAWAEGLEQATFVGSSGRVFPKAMKASPLLRAWLRRLDTLGVEMRLKHRWTGWTSQGHLSFQTVNGGALTLAPDATILALGGASWPRLGSDGAWVAPIKKVGIAVTPLSPSNAGVQVAWSRYMTERFNGAPLKRIAAAIGGETRRGEAVITRSGLEGGAIYALNPKVRDELEQNGSAVLTIDLRPDLTADIITAKLAAPRARQSASTFLRKSLALPPQAIALMREAKAGILPDAPGELAALVKAVPVTVTGLSGLERAISSAGGIGLKEIDGRLMLKSRPGTFLAGEMLDWEAPTGGYLLQATLATAVVAARGAVLWLASVDVGPEQGPDAERSS